MKDKVSFSVKLVGETSNKEFEGTFEVKTKLTHKDVLKEDEIRRTVLGVNPSDAGAYAASIATAIAYLSVRVVRSPDWFRFSNNGLDLEDENLLVEVNNRCIEAIDAERKTLVKEAEEAQKQIREQAAKA